MLLPFYGTLTNMPDRQGRRRPFSTLMKKLANLKSSSSADTNQASGSKRNAVQMKVQSKKQGSSKKNNPYMACNWNGSPSAPVNSHHLSLSTGRTASVSSLSRRRSFRSYIEGIQAPTIGNRSVTATVSTELETANSDTAQSHVASSAAETAATVGGPSTGRGVDSTFSSPAPSLRSLTTTLTTVQSTAAPAGAGNAANHGHAGNHGHYTIHFTHQFPSSPPPSALPPHLAPQSSGGHPATYATATANNLLTDNASILTLASSSKRHRRRSMDTDASVRALAPSSLFEGSRESLPLSVLSANIDPNNAVATPGLHQPRPSIGGPNERVSIYSATGVVPALPSERNSYYAGKQSILGDGGSVKSGLLGHGRTDSISGSIGGITATGSPLASPRETIPSAGKLSRSNSAWGEVGDVTSDAEKADSDRARS
jgi:hypothetical protein